MSDRKDQIEFIEEIDAVDSYFECITACSLRNEEIECLTQCVAVHLKGEVDEC